MTDPRTDAIAREAARLLETSRAGSIGEAIRAAVEALGFRDVDLPGHGRVRKHVQAMTMQMLGSAGYAESVRDVWRAAERLMTVLDETTPDLEPVLVGRAAEGHIDGGVTLHIRLYTDLSIGDVAATLVEYGYDEPSFETAETRHGRLNRARLTDDGIEIVLTRCPPRLVTDTATDLFTGRPIKTARLADVRAVLSAP